jgi:hypothetical protein
MSSFDRPVLECPLAATTASLASFQYPHRNHSPINLSFSVHYGFAVILLHSWRTIANIRHGSSVFLNEPEVGNPGNQRAAQTEIMQDRPESTSR